MYKCFFSSRCREDGVYRLLTGFRSIAWSQWQVFRMMKFVMRRRKAPEVVCFYFYFLACSICFSGWSECEFVEETNTFVHTWYWLRISFCNCAWTRVLSAEAQSAVVLKCKDFGNAYFICASLESFWVSFLFSSTFSNFRVFGSEQHKAE